MSKITNIAKEEYYKLIEQFYKKGIPNDYMYLVLYILSCYKEGFELEVVTEKSSIDHDNTLFGKEETKLDLYYEQYILVIKNVPEEKRIFLKINQIFSKFLNDQKTSKVISDYLNSSNFDNLVQFSHNDNFGEVFDVFQEIIVAGQGKRIGEFVLPVEVGEFLTKLGNLEPNASVFNPFAGLATFGVHLSDQQTYLGHEINELIWAVAVLRLHAHNRLDYSEFLNADSFGNWPSSRKFDLVIANPPFRLRLSLSQQVEFLEEKFVEGFFLNEGVKLLKPKGKLITIVPQGFLTGHSDKKTRQFLIDQDLLEAVIAFPGGLLMQTNIPFVVLLINKDKRHKNEIAFINGSDFVTKVDRSNKALDSKGLLKEIEGILGENNMLVNEPIAPYSSNTSIPSEFIGKDVISKNDFHLNIDRYQIEKIKGTGLKKVLSIEETLTFKQALDYNESENLHETIYRKSSRTIYVHHVSTKDLKTDPKDFDIDVSSLEKREVGSGKLIYKDTYLVSMIGGNLKPSFLPSRNTIVHLSNDVVPISINTKLIDPHWLVRELNSTKVKEQLKILVTGVIPRLRKEDFLNLKIDVPSIKQQQQEMEEIQGLEKRVDDLESDIIEQNSYLRHTVAGPLSDLDHAIKAIHTIIKNLSKNEMPHILKTKISDKHLYTLGEHIEDSKKHVAFIIDTIANKLNTSQSIEHKKLEKLNVLSLLKKYVKRKNENANSLGYSIDFDFDKDFFNDHLNEHFDVILGNKELINVLLDNMIDNASKHAFSKDKENRIEIYAWGYDEDVANKRICFTIANTGNPLPKGITLNDLKKRGYGKGSNQGDGFGLYLVNEIVRKHRGDWFLTDDSFEEALRPVDRSLSFGGKTFAIPSIEFVTTFSFNFPILEE